MEDREIEEYLANSNVIQDPFTNSLIPTSTSIRHMYLMEMLLESNLPVLLYGETGIGKSVEASHLLFEGMQKHCTPLKITFTHSTKIQHIQGKLEESLERQGDWNYYSFSIG